MGSEGYEEASASFDAAQERFLQGVGTLLAEPVPTHQAPVASEPLAQEPWPTLDPAALHGVAGEWVRLIEPHTEADPVGLVVSFLSEVGTLLGRGPHLILDGCFHPPLCASLRLWLLLWIPYGIG